MHFISLNEEHNLFIYTICLEKITIYFIYPRQKKTKPSRSRSHFNIYLNSSFFYSMACLRIKCNYHLINYNWSRYPNMQIHLLLLCYLWKPHLLKLNYIYTQQSLAMVQLYLYILWKIFEQLRFPGLILLPWETFLSRQIWHDPTTSKHFFCNSSKPICVLVLLKNMLHAEKSQL